MQNAPRPDLQPDELSVIRHVVMDFLAARTELPGFEFDDLFQECAIHWWQQRPRYDTRRGALRQTFLRRVVRAKLQDLARGWRAQKRGSGGRTLSLEAPASRRAPDGATIGEVLHDRRDLASNVSAAVDVESLIARLSARQRRIIEGVRAGMTKTDLGKKLGVSRDTLQEELRRIRQVSREEGLAPYLD